MAYTLDVEVHRTRERDENSGYELLGGIINQEFSSLQDALACVKILSNITFNTDEELLFGVRIKDPEGKRITAHVKLPANIV